MRIPDHLTCLLRNLYANSGTHTWKHLRTKQALFKLRGVGGDQAALLCTRGTYAAAVSGDELL